MNTEHRDDDQDTGARRSPGGSGGETHVKAGASDRRLTTNQGIPIADNQNSLHAGTSGPTLLEDFILREKITHFDHERIPERIVHARGSGAHGYFELTTSLAQYTRAKVLTEVGEQVPVFCRFSTVAGGAGSVDTPRDVRGFAVKFYTKEGNWDLVGNNIPVFFVQDAMKFPDLVHAVKMEPDRGFPQAASAHDTFWDFVSLMPESMHMIMWVMSDRTLPRSLRTIEGFGVHSFRLIDARGAITFVKFHWRPKLGLQSTLWDEAVKIAGADSDYHRRDLYEAIARGDYPEWELGVQLFTEDEAEKFPFDHLDPTKLIPEEVVPLVIVGKLVLNRWPDNFFAETEQVAFCPANVPPGIDFSNDPLLQGRLFSYLDTQLSRLGGPNFHQIPINAPKCPFHNLQRDGMMQMYSPRGRVSYEPSTLAPLAPKESIEGFVSAPVRHSGPKERARPASFADHYSQARQFYRSQTPLEQSHLASALVFELSKVETPHIRTAIVGHLRNVEESLGQRVANGLGLLELPSAPKPAAEIVDLDPAPSLGLIAKMKHTLKGRKVGALVADGSDRALFDALVTAVTAEGAQLIVIAPKIGGVAMNDGSYVTVDGQLAGTPSCLLDAVVLLLSSDAGLILSKEATAVDFVRDAYAHLKAIGISDGARPLVQRAGIDSDAGVIDPFGVKEFVDAAKTRQWSREANVRSLP